MADFLVQIRDSDAMATPGIYVDDSNTSADDVHYLGDLLEAALFVSGSPNI